MKLKLLILGTLFLITNIMNAQINNESLPYYEIPEYPENYNQGTVVARMIDGLGFRYFWATEDLRTEDLIFKPNETARTTEETIDHILGLSNVIVNSAIHQPNGNNDFSKLTYSEKRKLTLNNFKTAAGIFRKSKDLSQFKIVFVRDGKSVEYPFWNQINGPIEDAIWHCGQVVSFRRSSGNPLNAKVSVFEGKIRE